MKARNNFKYIIENFKFSLNTPKFLIIFVLSIVLAIYGTVQLGFSYKYTTAFIMILNGNIYSMCLLLVLLLNTININDIFSRNQFYVIRFLTKEKYLWELIKNVCFGNFCVLIINLILVMIGLNITCVGGFKILHLYQGIPNIISLIILVLKFMILTGFISIINVFLLKIFDNKLVILLNVILSISTVIIPTTGDAITSIMQFSLLIGRHYKIGGYSSIVFELLHFSLFLTLLSFVILCLKKITLKYMKRVIE